MEFLCLLADLSSKRSLLAAKFWLTACLLVVLPVVLEAQSFSDMNRLRQREIVAVEFIGDSEISSAELQSVIATHVSGWIDQSLNSLYSEFGAPPEYIDETIQGNDTLVLFQYYRSLGYLDARVKYAIHESKESIEKWQEVFDKNKQLPMNARKNLPNISDTVIFYIYEGKPYTIDLFTFQGIEHLPPELLKDITENISIKRGSKYTRQGLFDEVIRVRKILEENGYPYFTVPKDSAIVAQLDTVAKKVRISVTFITGPRIRNGEIHITYDSAYTDRGRVDAVVIEKQIKLEPGAWYRASDKRASEERLSRLGTFEILNVELDTSQYHVLDSIPDGTTLPISVFLRLRKRVSITPGLFVGSPIRGNSWNFGLSGSYSNNNVFNGAENLSFDASYQFLPTDQRNWSVGAQGILPTLLWNQPLIVGINYRYSKWIGIYKEVIGNIPVGTSILLSQGTVPRITLAPDITFEYVDRENYIDSGAKQNPDLSIKEPQFSIPATVNLTVDWTNNFLNPSSGSVVSSSFQTTRLLSPVAKLVPTNLPQADYNKATIQFKTYFDLSKNGRSIFAFRLSGGQIWLLSPDDSLKDITFERRFYAGGSNSMRGWPARDLLVSYDQTKDRPLTGGYKSFEANAEWRYAPFQFPAYTTIEQLIQDIRFALFVDVGNVWDRDVTPSLKTLAMDVGVGLHYNMIFGVFRLDFATRLYDPNPAFSSGNIVAASPDATGVWAFKRKFGDIYQITVGIGQSF